MNSHTTRRILCTALAFVITIALCISALTISMKATAFNATSINNSVQKYNVAKEVQSQLLASFQPLATQNSIPISVFENVASIETIKNIQTDMINAAYEGRVVNAFNADIEKIFYNNFVSYFEQNNITLDINKDNQLKDLAHKSATIFANTTDIEFIKSFGASTPSMNIAATRVLSIMLLLSVAIFGLMCVLYSKKLVYRASSYGASALIASGVVLIGVSLVLLIKGLNDFIIITPDYYAQALNSVFRSFNFINIIIGSILASIGFALYFYIYKTTVLKLEQKMKSRSSRRYVKFFTEDEEIDPKYLKHLEEAPPGTE